MTVKELIERLQKMPQDAPVYASAKEAYSYSSWTHGTYDGWKPIKEVNDLEVRVVIEVDGDAELEM